MPIRGQIYALDLGQSAGFCKGPPGRPPVSGGIRLYRPNEGIGRGFGNLIAFLNEEWAAECPELVVAARPFSLQAASAVGNSPDAVYSSYGFRAIVRGMADRFGIRYHEIHEATARKIFTGRGRAGSRAETKQMVLDRCHLLQFFPRSCRDDNRADAVCIHFAACHEYGSAVSKELFLFGEGQTEAKRARKTRRSSPRAGLV